MLNRVTGLFGWVEANDRRALQLFLAFLVWFQLLALVTSFLPLALVLPAYAPVYGWAGYLTVVVPGVTLLASAMFAVKMLWHVRVVRRQTGFRYVDGVEERRLCGIVEPLAIAAGIGTPYVGVIETPELNAFACGSRRGDAVIVVTRGLIDGLDDDQLAGVVAHEIAHIRGGDMRLMAAANICVSTMTTFFGRRETENWRIALGLLTTLVLPILFLLILGIGLITQVGFWLVYATRLGIASSREFVADAEAVRLTQNPAAFVSALRTIEGRSAIPGLAIDQSAMMIDGDADGETASHPRIAERIAAIVRLTGSMALIAPARRDTRAGATAGFGRRGIAARETATIEAALAESGGAADRSTFTLFRRVATDSPVSVFGFPKVINLALVAWVVLFLGIHHQALARPSELAAKFDVAQLRKLMEMGGGGSDCGIAQAKWVAGQAIGRTPDMQACDDLVTPGMIADQQRGGNWHLGGGRFTNVAPEAAQIAHILANRCYIGGATVSATRTLRLDETMTNVSLANYLAVIQQDLVHLQNAAPADRDFALMAYVGTRQTMEEVIFGYYGQPGAAVVAAEFARPAHRSALALVAPRMRDPAFVAALDPVQRAEFRLIAQHPDDYGSCKIKLGPDHLRPVVADPDASVAQEMRDAGLSLP